ncbi:metalloregulator ArsR/SmtB family transcription factor [Tunturiibacter empetritectus]|uniref:DNA-binding transcriptional ArsR family regulator n=1 Tax=Tunturiibacter lichenicola TaxID=2051959 RepID=A0A852VJX6_9BACT|nr:metalloregulator ArsR/SmtB family transcription factor [Edaphobacter lichenicola]NYF91940.1 DNA-binding transcriptional ArsR family regulator [Edaphobacter lichenicola]
MTTEDQVFRAIAHPARRAMLSILALSDRSVKELTNEFAMSQPAVSQHLKELKEAHLVCSNRVGLEQKYRLTPKPLRYIIEWSAQYRTLIDPAGHSWSFVSVPAATQVTARKRRQSHGS